MSLVSDFSENKDCSIVCLRRVNEYDNVDMTPLKWMKRKGAWTPYNKAVKGRIPNLYQGDKRD